MISKSEEIDIVKLFPRLDGSISFAPLTVVKQMIEISKDSLLPHCNQPQMHLVVRMLFPQLETGSSVADYTMHVVVAQKLKEAFLVYSSFEDFTCGTQ